MLCMHIVYVRYVCIIYATYVCYECISSLLHHVCTLCMNLMYAGRVCNVCMRVRYVLSGIVDVLCARATYVMLRM